MLPYDEIILPRPQATDEVESIVATRYLSASLFSLFDLLQNSMRDTHFHICSFAAEIRFENPVKFMPTRPHRTRESA